MSALLRAYHNALVKRPILTQCLTFGTLGVTGDVITQTLIEKQPVYNLKRTAKFGFLSLCYVGPAIALWLRFLERPFGARKLLLKPWQKVIIDQSFFNPQINLYALPILGVLAGHNWEKIKDTIKNNYVSIMKTSYSIWPAVQLINFYFVPILYRAVFVSTFLLIWNIYYTWKLGEKVSH